MQECEWLLEAFDKHTEWLVSEFPLRNFDATIVESIFNEPSESSMYGVIPVKLEHIDQLRKYTDAEFDTQKYDYFVECVAV
jgi:hypothetical protein